jgi:hypothetical protein
LALYGTLSIQAIFSGQHSCSAPNARARLIPLENLKQSATVLEEEYI